MQMLRDWLGPIVALTLTLMAGAAIAQGSPRLELKLAENWRFKQDNALASVMTPGFDDANWEVVSVPHTWNRVGYYLEDPASRNHTAQNTNKTQGLGWCRLNFTAPMNVPFMEPEAKPGERRFDGVVNGTVVLADLDVVSATGATLTAVIRTFDAIVADGVLELQFKPSKGNALVSGIEVVRVVS